MEQEATLSVNDIFSVAGKRVLVVGGTAGIGLGVAEHFARAGAAVAITGRRVNGEEVALRLGVDFVRMDLGDSASVVAGMEKACAIFSDTIDVLILNAGIGGTVAPCENVDLGAFRRIFDVNLFGIVEALQAGLTCLTSGGSIIVTSSPAGSHFMPEVAAYNASKAALNAVIQTAALELGPKGIRINAVLPGVVESELSFDSPDEDNTEELQTMSLLTATGKVRKPCELAPVFQFLGSQASVTLTGALLAADDGMTAGYSPLLIEKAFRP